MPQGETAGCPGVGAYILETFRLQTGGPAYIFVTQFTARWVDDLCVVGRLRSCLAGSQRVSRNEASQF